MTLEDKILILLRGLSGLTEAQIQDVLVPVGSKRRVKLACRHLMKAKRVQRRGLGGPGHPYRYFLFGEP